MLFKYFISFVIILSSSFSLSARDTEVSLREIVPLVGFAHKKWEGAKGFNYKQVKVDRCLDLMSAHMDGNRLVLKLRSNDKWTYTANVIWAGACPFPIRVRYFDENGEYLGHFVTKEYFIPRWGYNQDIADIPRWGYGHGQGGLDEENIIILEDEGTELVYRINARDAEYIEAVEVSMPVDNGDYIGPDTDYPYLLSRGDTDPSEEFEETEDAKKTKMLEEKRKAIYEVAERYRRERFQELDVMTREQREKLGVEPEYQELKLEAESEKKKEEEKKIKEAKSEKEGKVRFARYRIRDIVGQIASFKYLSKFSREGRLEPDMESEYQKVKLEVKEGLNKILLDDLPPLSQELNPDLESEYQKVRFELREELDAILFKELDSLSQEQRFTLDFESKYQELKLELEKEKKEKRKAKEAELEKEKFDHGNEFLLDVSNLIGR